MQQSSPFESGITLIEVLTTLAVVSLVLGLGVPGISDWIRNAQIRTTAEALQSGLQLARAEAVKRNAPVRFQLVDGAGAACTHSTRSGLWVVSLNDPAGKCDYVPADPPAPPAAAEGADPYIIQARLAMEIQAAVTVAANQGLIVFNVLGQRTAASAALGAVNLSVSSPAGGSCLAEGGTVRCLRVAVSTAGQIRLCDPSLAAGDPGSCPD
ncbi:MAG: Tfp pilus assembly protein FimT/FimU [Methylococcaceae bacterium]